MKVNQLVSWAAAASLSTAVVATPVPDAAALGERGQQDPAQMFHEWAQRFKKPHGSCKHPIVRKEWRTLSKAQKKSYLAAVSCLAHKPSVAKHVIPAAVTRYDDFNGIHNKQTPDIHWVGHFAQWHRLMLAEYEGALRNECGYTGAQPYWDWLQDTESDKAMTGWPIFDAATGFGGNGPYIELTPEENWMGIEGRSGGGCVLDGPFTSDKFSLAVGPGTDYNTTNPHCLRRDFAPPVAKEHLVREVWDEILSQPTYGHFARRLEALPGWSMKNVHGGGHFGVGGMLGSMGDANNSPGDPVFYLHHGNLDRVYWLWQQKDLSTRLKDVSGPSLAFDYDNALAPNVTLEFKINMDPLTDDVKLKDLMDTKGGYLCYTYE